MKLLNCNNNNNNKSIIYFSIDIVISVWIPIFFLIQMVNNCCLLTIYVKILKQNNSVALK